MDLGGPQKKKQHFPFIGASLPEALTCTTGYFEGVYNKNRISIPSSTVYEDKMEWDTYIFVHGHSLERTA